jgi:hypothetical protein
MRCEWCGENRPAEWWGWTKFNVAAWMCGRHLTDHGTRDASGEPEAIPAAERMAQMHKQGGAA